MLQNKSEGQWDLMLRHLNNNADEDINKVLRLSYDALPETDKKIFLDIACFFNGEDKIRVTKIFESCDFIPAIGIPTLVDRALITIEGGKVLVHDLLKQMAGHIIREEINAGRRSRSYDHDDALRLLEENKETGNVEGIFLISPSPHEISSNPFSNMRFLRLLKICNVNFSGLGNEIFLSRELRLLEWHGYPLKSIATRFQLNKLVELSIPNSHIQQLWNETTLLENLVLINLSNCKYLTKTPDFSMIPNLEKLILEGCISLSKVDPSVTVLKHLVLLNLKGCKSLQRLPKEISLESLVTFILSGCSNLKEFPEISGDMKNLSELYLDRTAIRELSTSVNRLTGLTLLDLGDCKYLLSLPNGILCHLTSLKSLNFSGCVSMEHLPEDLGRLEILEELFVDGTAIRQFPLSVLRLRNLKLLSLRRYGVIPHKLWKSLFFCCPLTLEFYEFLDLQLPNDISQLLSLQQLDLSESNLRGIPESISRLSKLIDLRLSKSRNLRSLPKNLPLSLRKLERRDCPMLTTDSLDSFIMRSYGERFRFIDARNSSGVDHEDCTFQPPLARTDFQPGILFGEFIKELIDYGKQFEIFFPSNRIPQWFLHWTRESPLMIELSLEDHDHNPDRRGTRKGFALFVVFETKQHVNSDEVQELNSISCRFAIDNQRLEISIVFADFEDSRAGSHAVCCYVPLERFARQLNSSSHVMNTSILTGRKDIELRMFGVHEVFEQGVEDFSKKLAQSANEHLDLELNFSRHCKYLLDGANELLETPDNIIKVGHGLRKGNATEPSHFAWDNIPTIEIKSFLHETYSLLTKIFEGSFARRKYFLLHLPNAILSPWFFHHSVGNVAVCYLPPNVYNDERWLGLELYVQCGHSIDDSTSQEFNLEVDLYAHGKSIFPMLNFQFNIPLGCFFVIHLPRKYFPEVLNICEGISVFFKPITPNVEVRMCGTRLLYEKESKFISKGIIECLFWRFDFVRTLHNSVKQMLQYCEINDDDDDHNVAVEEEMKRSLILMLPSEKRLWKILESSHNLLTSTTQLAKEVSTSLHNHRKEFIEEQAPNESVPILFHSKHSFLEIWDSVEKGILQSMPATFNHLHIMVETLCIGNSQHHIGTFERFLRLFFDGRVLVTVSLEGQITFVLRHFHPSPAYNLCLPRRGIPEWFVHQQSNSKVVIELPPNLSDDKNWRGLVLCADFSINEHPDAFVESSFRLIYHLASEGQCLNPVALCSVTKDKVKWLHQRGFIWLTYIPRDALIELKGKHSVEARIYHYCPAGVIVDKCGIRLLYDKDVEGLRETIIQCCISAVEDLVRISKLLASDDDESESELPYTEYGETSGTKDREDP